MTTSSLHKRIGGVVVLAGVTSLYLFAQGTNPVFTIQSLTQLVQITECGNAIKEYGEDCDDGNLIDTDSCRNDCSIRKECEKEHLVAAPLGCRYEFNRNSDGCQESYLVCSVQCGDAKINQETEECDDGNTIDTDFCSNACKKSLCGDGMVQQGEQCDSAIVGDQCGAGFSCSECDCLKPKFCGDAQVNQNIEQCDDGNTNNNDGCSTLCKSCIVLLLPDAPVGCFYTTNYNSDDCPIQRLVCGDQICSNGLDKTVYGDCMCPVGTYLEQREEDCIIDPVTELASCKASARCVVEREVFTTQSVDENPESENEIFIDTSDEEKVQALIASLETEIQDIVVQNISNTGKRLLVKRLYRTYTQGLDKEGVVFIALDNRLKQELLRLSQ